MWRGPILLFLAVCCVNGKITGEVGDEEVSAHAAFLDWLKAEGFPEHNLEIALFDSKEVPGQSYRGLRTKVDIKHGEEMLRVPKKFFMYKLADAAPAVDAALEDVRSELPARVYLACKALVDSADASSWWAPYWRVVPREHSSLLFFTDAELAELQCPAGACPVVDRVARMNTELAEAFEKVQPRLRDLLPTEELTLDRFKWAYITVASRAFALNVTDTYGTSLTETAPTWTGHTPLMIPLADLLNHHNSEPALQFSYEYVDESGTMRVFADQDYAAGDQVFISYGILPNPDLAVTYGFVMTDNLYETVGISLGLERNDPLAPAKAQLLRDRQLTRFTDTHIALDGEPSPQFVEAMRVREFLPPKQPLESAPPPPPHFDPRAAPDAVPTLTAAEQALLKETSERMVATDFSVPVSGDNEFEVFNSLIMNAEALLRQYPTTLWQDAAAVRNGSLSRRAAVATTMRAEVKRVLASAVLEGLAGVKRAYILQERERSRGWAARVQALREGGEVERAEGLSRVYEDMRKHWRRGMAKWEDQWRGWRRAVEAVWGGSGTRAAMRRAFDPKAMARAQGQLMETVINGVQQAAREGKGVDAIAAAVQEAGADGALASALARLTSQEAADDDDTARGDADESGGETEETATASVSVQDALALQQLMNVRVGQPAQGL